MHKKFTILVTVSLFVPWLVLAASADEILAKVNGAAITQEAVKQRLAFLPGRDHEESTRRQLDHLIDEELLAQDAVKLKLNQQSIIAEKLRSARAAILADAAVQAKIVQRKITDNDLRAFQQKQLAKGLGEQYQYELVQFQEKAHGEQLIQRLAAGDSLEVALSKAAGARARSRQTDWVDANHIPPEIVSTVMKLLPNQWNQMPIQIDEKWVVVQLINRKKMVKGSFEVTKLGIQRQMELQIQQDYAKSLREKATVEYKKAN